MARQRKLGEILVDLKVLTEADVERVLATVQRRGQRKKFGEMAVEMGLAREEDILAALAVQMELFPGIQRLSLPEILRHLQAPQAGPA
jgi:hypothetical protein